MSLELGSEGNHRYAARGILGGIDEAYNLMIRDYAVDSSAEEARHSPPGFHETANTLRSAESVGRSLPDLAAEKCVHGSLLGLRTLSRVHVVNDDRGQNC